MTYPLNPAQKAILAAAGQDVNFVGDDNDLGCVLSRIELDLFMAGELVRAWDCYHQNPGSCYGVTFDAWESAMKSHVIRHLQSELAAVAHNKSMENAG